LATRELKIREIELLKNAMNLLGLSQIELAKGADYSASSISDIFKSRSKKADIVRKTSIRESSFNKIISFLEEKANSAEAQKKISKENLLRARKNLKAVELKIPLERYITQTPSGILGEDILNYIERACDRELSRILNDDVVAPVSIVLGGPLSGKSSLVWRFHKEAEKKQKSFFIDFKDLEYQGEKITASQVFSFIMNSLVSQHELNEYNGTQVVIDQILSIIEEIYKNENKKYYLVIDSFDSLFNVFETKKESENFFRWFSAFLDKLRRLGFNRFVNIICVISLQTMNYEHSDFRTRAAHRVHLENFKKNEVEKLSSILALKKGEVSDKVYDLFEGQPFLTHNFLYRIQFEDFNSVYHDTVLLVREFGSYWNKIQKWLYAVTEGQIGDNLIQCLLAFRDFKVDTPNYRLFYKHREYLEVIGLIDKKSMQIANTIFFKKIVETLQRNNNL